jgi:hypothetical protein
MSNLTTTNDFPSFVMNSELWGKSTFDSGHEFVWGRGKALYQGGWIHRS